MQALRKDLTKKNTFSYRHCSHCIGGRPPAQIGFDALLTLFDSGGRRGGLDLPQKKPVGIIQWMMISLRHASPNPWYEVVGSVEMSGNAVAFGLGGVHLVATNTYRSDPILATTLIVLLMPPHIKAALIWSLYHAHHYSVDVSLWSRVLSYHDQGHPQSLTLWITTIFDCSCPPANTTCLQRITLINWQPFCRLIENETNHHFIHCPKPATECFTSDTLY